MGKYYIAFDAGTSSVKVVLYNLEMECIAEYNTPTRFEYPYSGWVQMNADDYFEGVKEGIRACVTQAKRRGSTRRRSVRSSVTGSSAASWVSMKTARPSLHISITWIPGPRRMWRSSPP